MKEMKRGERQLVDRKQFHHEIIDKDLVFPGCRGQMPSRFGLANRRAGATSHVQDAAR
jgi:hypothetical protein